MARGSSPHLAALLLVLLCAGRATADTLSITSKPPGATVEIDGVAAGKTPFEKDYPGGYFHKTRTSMGSRLEHPMVARISLAGYAPKEIKLTEGPMSWISLNGRNRGDYWLLKSNHFEVELQTIPEVFTGGVTAKLSGAGSVDLGPELSLEEPAHRTKPAVVNLRGLEKSGTGFFVTETGVIATNAHVARDEESLRAILPGGEQLEARVVYIDAELDIALVKVEGKSFPHLALADASTVRQGETVLAIGNPGDAMEFSMTKGIVSAVGKFPNAGPGTWIQTDAQINPGSSGGPLLNGRGEVIGINTQKLVKKNVTGIGFALSATDLLEVLRRFYPNVAAQSLTGESAKGVSDSEVVATARAGGNVQPVSSDSGVAETGESEPSGAVGAPAPHGFGTIVITAEPESAEIYIDEKFVGNAPAKLKLAAGSHVVVVKASGFADWKRTLETLKDSQVTLRPLLERKK